MEALNRFLSSITGRIVAGFLVLLVVAGVLSALRRPWDATNNVEIRRAIQKQVQLDCYNAARRQSSGAGDNERQALWMVNCQTLQVRSIRVRGRFSRPVARVVMQRSSVEIPEGMRVRYYRLEPRFMNWDARPASEISYEMALF